MKEEIEFLLTIFIATFPFWLAVALGLLSL